MSGKRYPEEFKIEAVKQVTERFSKVSEVAQRLGVTGKVCMTGSSARYTKPEMRRGLRCSTTSIFTTTRSAAMATTTAFHEWSLKNGILRSCRASRKPVACQDPKKNRLEGPRIRRPTSETGKVVTLEKYEIVSPRPWLHAMGPTRP